MTWRQRNNSATSASWLQRGLRAFVALALVLGLGGVAAAVFTVQRSFPTLDGVIEIPALDAEVTVRRGADGAASIQAETSDDLFVAQGYIQAQDRFWQMELSRRAATGTLAALLGPEQVLSDRWSRALDFTGLARAELATLDQQTLANLDAFAAGVTAYLRDRSPPEIGLEYALLGLGADAPTPAPWTAADSLAWLAFDNWRKQKRAIEIERQVAITGGLLPEGLAEDLAPSEGYHPGLAGTAVARKAEAGAQLSVSLFDEPALNASWYPISLECAPVTTRCPFQVSGLAQPALPGVYQGANAAVAWHLGPYPADSADLVLERVRVQQSQSGDAWQPMAQRREVIDVRGAPPQTLVIRSTAHGPLVSDLDPAFATVGANAAGPPDDEFKGAGYGVALQRTGSLPSRAMAAIFAMNRATDWTSWRRAVAQWGGPPVVGTYADASGVIAQQVAGRIPLRRSDSGSSPRLGWRTQEDWTGRWIRAAELPSIVDPGQNELISAGQRVEPALAYDIGNNFADPARASRIAELLEAPGTLADDVPAALSDPQSLIWQTWRPYLAGVGLRGDFERLGWDLLRVWDGEQHRGSGAAAYFNAVVRATMRLTLADQVPESVGSLEDSRWLRIMTTLLAEPDHPLFDDAETPALETRDDILRAALLQARDELIRTQDRQAERWRWDRTHQAELSRVDGRLESWLGRRLGRVRLAAAGSADAVLATASDAEGGLGLAQAAAYDVDFAAGQLRLSWLGGVSGHPFGPYDTEPELSARRPGVTWALPGSASEETRAASAHELTLVPNRTN